ncbi:MAG: ABC transporter substrate-binding protein, partial [Actinomycetota bacterium]|nr:ABC transporter substrate-binding protein [Actinomycetota bacterium]
GSGGSSGGTVAGGGGTGGEATAAGSDGPSPCAAPSTEVGVTDDTITLGGVFQLSGPVTGFAEQFLTGVRAKLAQANGTGGVCGRRIEYLSRDDGFDAARNASQTRDLIPKVLAITGSFSTVDNGGATALAGTNVPDVSVAGTPERFNLPNHVSHNHFPSVNTPFPEFAHLQAQGVKTAVLVYVSLASARGLMDTYQAVLAKHGIQVVKRVELSPTQFSYDATAREVANSGAEVMYFLHELNAASSMAQALANVPHKLRYPIFSSFSYGKNFLELAGAAAEGMMTVLAFPPFEEAASNPPTQEFLKWLQQAAPGANPTFDALNGWTTTTLFLDALAAVPGPITRDAVLAALKAVGAFDGSGVWAPSMPNDKLSASCNVLMRVQGGKYVREAPARGFLCST